MELWIALALVLVIEGLLPALAPRRYRQVLLGVAQMDERSIRTAGVISMLIGAALLYWLKN